MSKSETDMPYTEFRKSYGDFEIVIPAIDFSSLTRTEARRAIDALRSYECGHVCSNMNYYYTEYVASLIDDMITECTGVRNKTINSMINRQFGYDDDMPFFHAYDQSGITLRKAWCEHMAEEIKREFGLKL